MIIVKATYLIILLDEILSFRYNGLTHHTVMKMSIFNARFHDLVYYAINNISRNQSNIPYRAYMVNCCN